MFGELPPDADDTLQMMRVYPSPAEVLENEELGRSQSVRRFVSFHRGSGAFLRCATEGNSRLKR